MFDFLLRACLNPLDYISILNKNTLSLIEHKEEGNNVHSFTFTSNKNLSWKAGQHGVFILPNVSGKSWRAFSIASSPAENVIKISTVITDSPSDFKKKLLGMDIGDKITMHGPFGEFHVSPKTKIIVGIAGGIGITPFRAIMYEIYNNYITDVKFHLIYAGKNNFFTFHEEFNTFLQHPNISIDFVNTPEEVNFEITKKTSMYKNTAEYFISGSPGMIKSIKDNLTTLGIKKIINDPFKGY